METERKGDKMNDQEYKAWKEAKKQQAISEFLKHPLLAPNRDEEQVIEANRIWKENNS